MPNIYEQQPGEYRLPDLIPLPDGRWQMLRYKQFPAPHHALLPYASLFEMALSGDQATQFSGLRLISRDPGYVPGKPSVAGLVETYEQIPETGFIVSGPEQIDYDLNGLERITRPYVGFTGQPVPDEWVVGTMESGASSNRFLAQVKIERTVAVQRATLVFLQPGVISKAVSDGPITGTLSHSWQTWRVDATSEADMGAGNTIPGVLTAKGDSNYEGFKVRTWQSVAPTAGGSITGVKTTYADTVEVQTPGTVALTTVAITAGTLSGTDAVIDYKPPRTKTVAATVTIEVTTTPPDTAALAYNLENISCSVTNTRASYSYVGSDIYTTVNGNASIAVPKYRGNVNASISTFPGCYITGSTSATGSFTYTAGSEASGLGTSTIVVTPIEANITNKLTGYGSTSTTGYATTGVLRRKVRPIITAIDGTVYWEVVTWSV